jgi:hypothetical protein
MRIAPLGWLVVADNVCRSLMPDNTRAAAENDAEFTAVHKLSEFLPTQHSAKARKNPEEESTYYARKRGIARLQFEPKVM